MRRNGLLCGIPTFVQWRKWKLQRLQAEQDVKDFTNYSQVLRFLECQYFFDKFEDYASKLLPIT